MRSYPHAADVFPDNPHGMNLVLIEQCRSHLTRSHAIDADAADGAGVIQVQRGVQLYLGDLLHAAGPVVFQIADALLLPLAADSLMEVDRFSNALLQREAPRAQVFKLADVSRMRSAITHQRPKL